ncbi:hypothetical protein, partial [Clostridioides difficile]|uniref:hypothetical protein n=1 Tax=Clostridioides difficile TaxID=1496 RepID=UPI00115D31E2
RTNIQSRALVDVFMDMKIPFVVKDSVITIYDHCASQDILAYLNIHHINLQFPQNLLLTNYY